MNNDLISRSALKDRAKTMLKIIGEDNLSDYEQGKKYAFETAIDFIDNAPTVEVEITEKQAILLLINSGWLVNHDKELREKWERPQGEWIVKVERYGCYVGDRTVYSYTCPFCGRKEFGTYPFCHCGAELRGEEK